MSSEHAEIEQRLRSGEWLRPGEIAAVLGVARSTVDRMLNAGTIRHRLLPGTGRYRTGNPEDVLRELANARQIHGGGAEQEPGGTV